MSRGIDHVVHAVHDLDAAVAIYRGLGFTVGARNRHPPAWGTQNHIVQFAGCFIELLALADMSQTVPHRQRHFSFGAFNRDFLARGQGLSMLVLEGAGARDADEFRASNIGDFDPFDFERQAKRTDGTPVKVAFTLAFARNPDAPDAGFFTCRQHFPENFWNPAFQNHPNTATTIAGVVMVADNPSEHHIFLSAFTGERAMLTTSAGISLKTPCGEIQVMTPLSYRDHFGTEPPDVGRGARLAALRLATRNLDAVKAQAQSAGVAAAERMGRLIVGPAAGLGAALAFEAR